jgi:hypothetical protein
MQQHRTGRASGDVENPIRLDQHAGRQSAQPPASDLGIDSVSPDSCHQRALQVRAVQTIVNTHAFTITASSLTRQPIANGLWITRRIPG